MFRDTCPGYKGLMLFGRLEPGFQQLLNFRDAFQPFFDEQPNCPRETVSNIVQLEVVTYSHINTCPHVNF